MSLYLCLCCLTRAVISLVVECLFFFYFLRSSICVLFFFFFQAEDGIRDVAVTGVQRVLFRSSNEFEATISDTARPAPNFLHSCRKGRSVTPAIGATKRLLRKVREPIRIDDHGDRKSVV